MAAQTCNLSRRVTFWTIAIVFGLLPFAVTDALARQAGTSATIIGQVTDASGAVLPGVTVTLTSPALQVPEMTAVTDERGEYRLTTLPIGTYTATYELNGFQTSRREGIRLTVGFTARLDVALGVGALQETVTVSGSAPLVDVASTTTTTQLTRETLELLPTSRNSFNAMMIQTPSARTSVRLDVGGSGFNDSPRFHTMGQLGESWQGVEDIIMQGPASNPSGSYVDYSTLEEATVQVMGHSAATPTRGLAINGVIKSGGNDFHGQGFYSRTSGNLKSDNITPELLQQGISEGDKLRLRDDFSGEIGGRLVRDKLWFFAASRQRRQHDDILGCFLPVDDGNPDGALSTDPCVGTERTRFVTAKVTLQLNQSDKIVGFAQPNWRFGERGGSAVALWETRTYRTPGSDGVWKGEYQTVRSDRFVVDALFGGFYVRSGDSDLGQTRRAGARDRTTLNQWGASDSTGSRNNIDRWQGRGTATWFQPDGPAGKHEIKAGFDLHWTSAERSQLPRGPIGNYTLEFNRGVADRIILLNSPVYPDTPMQFTHLYVQDSWNVGRKLTLNLGARFAHETAVIPEQCREAAEAPSHITFPAECYERQEMPAYNSLAPRLHGAYDLFGNARTVIKGGWARYYHMRSSDDLQIANKNTISQARYRWRDLNGNRDYDPGEVNLDPNGADFIDRTLRGIGSAFGGGIINPDTTQRYQDELLLSVEQQLSADWGVRVTGVHAEAKNQWRLANALRPYEAHNIPVPNLDPGPDGVLGTADDTGNVITYYDYPASLAGLAFQQPWLVNDDRANSSFNTVEFQVARRYAENWQFRASYSATKKHIPLVTNQGNNQTGFFNTQDPNAEIFAEDNTWEWIFRAGGSYLFRYGILGSVNFSHESGIPWARRVELSGGRQIPTLVVNVEPIGTRRLDNLNLLDIRGEKRFSVGSGQQVVVRLNLYNALNKPTVLGVQMQSGPRFNTVTSIVSPRILEWGLSYVF
jgi:hypothetical protein